MKRPGEAVGEVLERLLPKVPRSRFPTWEAMGISPEKIAALRAAPRSPSPRRVHIMVPRPEADSNGFFSLKGEKMEALLDAFQGETVTLDWGGLPALWGLDEDAIDLLVLGGHGTETGEIVWNPQRATSLKRLPPDVVRTLSKVRKIVLLSCYQGTPEGAALSLAQQTHVPVVAASGKIVSLAGDADGALAFYDEHEWRNDYDFTADRGPVPRFLSGNEPYSPELIDRLGELARQGNEREADLLFKESYKRGFEVSDDVAWMWLEKGNPNAISYFTEMFPESLEAQNRILTTVKGGDLESLQLRALALAKTGRALSEILELLAPQRRTSIEFDVLDFLIEHGEYRVAVLWAEHPSNSFSQDMKEGVLEDAYCEGVLEAFDRISRETLNGCLALGKFYLKGVGTYLAPNWVEAERYFIEGTKVPITPENRHLAQECAWLLCSMGKWEWGVRYADILIQQMKEREAVQLLAYLNSVRGVEPALARLEVLAAEGCAEAREQLKAGSLVPFETSDWAVLKEIAPQLQKFEPKIALLLASQSREEGKQHYSHYFAALMGSEEGLARLDPDYAGKEGLERMQRARAASLLVNITRDL